MKHIARAVAVATVMVAMAAAAMSPVQSQPAPAADVITVGVGVETTSVDPHFHNISPNNALALHIFDGLVRTDDNLRPVPALAVSWRAVTDTIWEFKLRQGVTWHDGTPFTADDVLFTMERAKNVADSPSGFGFYVRGKTFEKVDDFTVRVTTATPQPLLVNDLWNVAIVSHTAAADGRTEDFNSGKAAVGTGPYKFVDWQPGKRLVLEANRDYWGRKPQFDRVVFRPITQPQDRVKALLGGTADLIDAVPTPDIRRLRADKRVVLSSGVSNRVIYLHLDRFRDSSPYVRDADGKVLEINPLNDLRVRRAMSKAINRDGIVERVMEGIAIPAGQLLPDGFFATSPTLQPDLYDPGGAKALLTDAGYPRGFRLTLHCPKGRYLNDAQVCAAIGEMLTAVGIRTRVETLPPADFFVQASSGGAGGTPKFSMILAGWGADTGEPSSPLRALLNTYDPETGSGSANRGRYANPEVDRLTDEALAAVDEVKRERLLRQATELAIEDLGIIPLHYQVNTWATRQGLAYVPRGDEYTLVTNVIRK